MKFVIIKRDIKCIDESIDFLIGDNADYKATFIFDEEWDGHIKTARFIQNGQFVEKILENDECTIPVEVLKSGCLKVGVFTPEMATTSCEVYIRPSIKEIDGNTAEPTPDIYSQIIAMIEQIQVGQVTDEQIEKAVAKYMSEHPNGPIEPTDPDDPDEPTVSQTGTWQFKTTTGKKYIILGTDDDNSGNAKYFRMLRTYGFPYTMNVESENVSKLNELGNDVDDTIFNSEDAPALFPDGVDVVTLGKYLHDNNLGEVAQHGASSKTLWDSEKLAGDFLTSLHTSYVEQGGTKTEEELRAAIMEQLADTDGSQGAVYVDNSKATLEDTYGFPIYTVGAWGGSPTATIDGIIFNLNSIKGTSNYDWRAKNYTAVGALVGQFRTNKSTYDLARITCGVDEVSSYIERIESDKVCEFFWHMPFNDEPDISKWRTLFDYIKGLVDSGEAEVVTRKQYAELGEYVDNPITKITISRDNIPVGETDSDSAYIITATYADATTADVTDEAILNRSAVNTETAGSYTVSATYRGFNAITTVSVIDVNYTIPDGLKDTSYWFVFKNDTMNMYFAGNTTGAIGTAGTSSLRLAFTGCTSGKLNGWKSTDGQIWEQTDSGETHYSTIKTTSGSGNFEFNIGSNDSITFLETSGNFTISY